MYRKTNTKKTIIFNNDQKLSNVFILLYFSKVDSKSLCTIRTLAQKHSQLDCIQRQQDGLESKFKANAINWPSAPTRKYKNCPVGKSITQMGLAALSKTHHTNVTCSSSILFCMSLFLKIPLKRSNVITSNTISLIDLTLLMQLQMFIQPLSHALLPNTFCKVWPSDLWMVIARGGSRLVQLVSGN